MQAPFPWFGGKRRVASEVWTRFGAVDNYVEPFFGSGAVLLGRPTPFDGTETVNDLDGYVANFWRAVPSEWTVYRWSAGEGFGGQATARTNNGDRERIWFSPACVMRSMPLFDGWADASC